MNMKYIYSIVITFTVFNKLYIAIPTTTTTTSCITTRKVTTVI